MGQENPQHRAVQRRLIKTYKQTIRTCDEILAAADYFNKECALPGDKPLTPDDAEPVLWALTHRRWARKALAAVRAWERIPEQPE